MRKLSKGYSSMGVHDVDKKEIFDKDGVIKVKKGSYLVRIKNNRNTMSRNPYVSLAKFKKKNDAELFYENYLKGCANLQ